MQGHEQGQSDGAPGGGHSDHICWERTAGSEQGVRLLPAYCCQAERTAHCLGALAASYNHQARPRPCHPALPHRTGRAWSQGHRLLPGRLARPSLRGGRRVGAEEGGGEKETLAPSSVLGAPPKVRRLPATPTPPGTSPSPLGFLQVISQSARAPPPLSLWLLPRFCPELRV